MFKRFGGPKKKSVLEENELTTGIVQHPVTGLWQTWIFVTWLVVRIDKRKPSVKTLTVTFIGIFHLI